MKKEYCLACNLIKDKPTDYMSETEIVQCIVLLTCAAIKKMGLEEILNNFCSSCEASLERLS